MSEKARGHSMQKDPYYGAQRNSNGAQVISKRHSTESGHKRRRQERDEDYDSEAEYLNFDKLKKFHIPRKKSYEEREILSELSMESREYTHTVYPTFRSSFFDPQASRKLTILRVETIRNQKLEKEYLAKKKDLKDEGRSDKEVSDSFGYLHYFRRSEVEKICRDGVVVGHSNLASLGKPSMGVYISKHADIVRFSKWEDGLTGYIIMFKIMKGKTKVVLENRSPVTEQEPTPLYDCHIAKIPIDVAQSIHSRAFIGFQYYLYEYGDLDIVERPRQVLPYAVLKYSYSDTGNSVVAAAHNTRRESLLDDAPSASSSSAPSVTLSCDSGFCHWRGKLLVKSGTFCSVEIRSHVDTVFNVASIDRNINVKSCLSLDKLSRHLPPTMMSKSVKKYNVIYRGRHYNTFTLHPMEEGSGLGKFRQLIALLVKESAVAFVPLRNNSTMFLLPMSELTMNLGLVNYSPETVDSDSSKHSSRMWKNFLHVIVITPKVMSSKINDQRVFNIVHARKRKDPSSQASSTLKDALEAKLRMMNIDPSSALSSMEQDQYQKIYDRIKNRKRVQNSEKMLHTHYKETDAMSTTSKAIWIKNLAIMWTGGAKQQQEFYLSKKKLKVIPSPKHSRSLSKSSDSAGDATMDDHAEATFSDDDDTVKAQESQKKRHRYEEPRGRSQDSRYSSREDPRLTSPKKPTPMPYLPLPAKPPVNVVAGTSSSILRPSFKPLEELIFCGQLQELLRHPEFNFSEAYCSSHKVDGYISSSFMSWDESHPPLKITFSQVVPFMQNSVDCPFAFEDDAIILSMLRAIHGEYNPVDDLPEDHDKVKWVRKILHNHSSETSSATQPVDVMARKIDGSQKSSPQFTEASPHPSSTDSGFISSSAAATPGSLPVLDAVSPSLKDIASILASALSQTQASEHSSSDTVIVEDNTSHGRGENPDMELAAKALLEVLTQSNQAADLGKKSLNDEDIHGVDMELGSTPESPLAKPDSSESDMPLCDKPDKKLTMDSSVTTKSPLPQGTVGTGKGPLLLPQSHPRLQRTVKSSLQRALIALQRMKPGCTMTALQDILRKVVLKIKGMRMKKVISNTTVKGQILKRKENQIGQMTGLSMTVKLATKTGVITQSTGMIAEKTALKGSLLQKKDKQGTENPATSGILNRKVNLPITIGIDQWKERQATGTTVPIQSAFSVIDQTKATSKNFMTMTHNLVTREDTHYSVMPPQSIGNTAVTKDGQGSLDAGHSSKIQTTTHIKPTRNPTTYQTPMYYGVGPPNIYQGPGPFYPTQVPVAHPHYLVPVPPPHIQPYHQPEINTVGGNIGFSNSMKSSGAISKQNTELLNSIIALMNQQRTDPRNAQPVTPGQHHHKSLLSTHLQPADIAKLMPQINALLLQASADPLSTKPGVSSVKSPVLQSGTSGASLSVEDIIRIREKKERLKAKRKSEKELCKREAMYMREELNKNLEKKLKHSKKHKTSHQPHTSPASSTHSGEGHSDKLTVSKPSSSTSSNLPFPPHAASPQVLQSVATALALSPSSNDLRNVAENETIPRPTGIVTPKPRPIHPIFMESRNSFPLTESTSSQQNVTSSPLSTDDRSRVISEIDQTLSVLKQEMQTNQDNAEVKDSMSKLLQLVIKLGGATPHDDRAEILEEQSMADPDTSVHPLLEDCEQTEEISNEITLDSREPEPSNEATHDGRESEPSNEIVQDSTEPEPSNEIVQDSTEPELSIETTTDCRKPEPSNEITRDSREPDPSTEATHDHTERTDLILNPIETPKDTIPFISDDSAFSQLSTRSEGDAVTKTANTSTEALNKPNDSVVPFTSDDSTYSHHAPSCTNITTTDTSSGEFPVFTSTGARKYTTQNIDELLSKVKPAIESINKMQSFNKSDHCLQADSNSVGEKIQVIGSVTSTKLEQNLNMSDILTAESTVDPPTNFTTVPSALVTIVQPKPIPALSEIQPIQSLAKNPEPIPTIVMDEVPSIASTLPEEPELCVTAKTVEDKTEGTARQTPVAKSDRGTPTLDERYPEVTVTEGQSKTHTKCNPFHVFNPDRSMECEAFCLYLESVHGVHVDIVEAFGKLCENLKALDRHQLDVTTLKNQYINALPKGTLWVVFRSDDVSRVHLVPNIALLKAAGSHVQFVSANSVRDVRMRKYRNLFAGDGGIVVPLCPKTVLTKSDSFRHILMWLIGQGKGCRSRNRWRIGFHQHILNALQQAQKSDDDFECGNARQISDWICHANDVKPRVLIELPKHHCDSVLSTKVAANAWNFYDRVSDDKLAKSVFRCALKLQEDRVDQLRHVVLLIDGDPGAKCWHPIWQCGICVATAENFVRQICSQHTEVSAQPSMSCVLPLYKDGLPCLTEKLGKVFLEM